jgi:thioredoxin reductase
MTNHKIFDVIIIGGSYAGLSAAMSLGRSLRNVLVIDSGKPCNVQTPHSHNFLTQDGKTPQEISSLAKLQVEQYRTIEFYKGIATKGSRTDHGFEIRTESGDVFQSRKILFATGLKDQMPNIKGFADCWGISAVHCPYCHGYEHRQRKTGIIANGEMAIPYVQLVSNLTKDLTLFTNGPSTLTAEQTALLISRNITIIETEVMELKHDKGAIQQIILKDNQALSIEVVYHKAAVVQHCDIPAALGCDLTEQGYIKVDAMQKTNIPGIFVAGDNSIMMRSVANAVAAGNFAGAVINKELSEERF